MEILLKGNFAMTRRLRHLIVPCCVLLAALSPLPAFAATNVLFIFDASGSMWGQVGGRPKIEVARTALKALLADLPPDVNVGLMVYGHRSEGDCNDIEMVSAVGANPPGALSTRIDGIAPKGKTPLSQSLTRSADAFRAAKDDRNVVVLVTDGIESCNADPCRAAAAVRAAGLNVSVDVIGFDLSDQDRAAVQCIADQGGGRYYDAKNAPQLAQAMTQVREQVAQAQPAPQPAASENDINLLSPANGGELLVAPEEHWNKIVSGNDRDKSGLVRANQEAIFAFKDEQSATFSKFTMLIPDQNGSNPKDFELLVADDLAGPYRSIGTCTTQNVRLMRTPYQEFTFPSTKARYLKLQAISAWDPNVSITIPQIRLMGHLD